MYINSGEKAGSVQKVMYEIDSIGMQKNSAVDIWLCLPTSFGSL